MNKFRAIIYIILFLCGLGLLVYFLSNLINTKLDQTPAVAETSTTTTQTSTVTTPSTPAVTNQVPNTTTADTSTTTTASVPSDAVEVTTIKLASVQNSYFQSIGAVKSSQSISLFPQASATVKKVNFQEGDYVQAGDTLVELTGNNLTEHPSETQLKIAEQSLANAQSSYDSLKKTSNETLKTAGLQLQSAVSQASAIAYDLQVIEQNKTGLQDSLNTLQDSLNNTQQKNQRDDLKAKNDIDHLIYTLNQAQSDRGQTQRQIDDLQAQIDNLKFNQAGSGLMSVTPSGDIPVAVAASTSTSSADQQKALQAQLDKLTASLPAQDKAISDLYDGISKAKYGLNTADNAAALGVNQIQGQIDSAQNQAKILDLNLASTKAKLGYTGDSSDGLKLAQQAYDATKVQLQTALDSAANGVKLAQLNVELSKNQASALQVKAPFAGVITSLDLSPGESVNPQAAVAEVINPQGFELQLGVDPSTADRLDSSAQAQITLAGHQIDVPIKSISPKVDDKTKLVTVTLTLPNIFFKLNQTFSAQLPLTTSNAINGSLFLPLDAVIIGTETQFVYVNNNGKAKKVPVQIGNISGDQIAILSGLDPAAEVILTGAKNLTDGQSIIVK